MVVENGDFGVVRRDESVELFLVKVPLDRVQVVSFHVIVATENSLVAFQRVWGDHRVGQQPHTLTHCKQKNTIETVSYVNTDDFICPSGINALPFDNGGW